MPTLDEKLEDLRRCWKKASQTERKILEMRGKLLLAAKKEREEKVKALEGIFS